MSQDDEWDEDAGVNSETIPSDSTGIESHEPQNQAPGAEHYRQQFFEITSDDGLSTDDKIQRMLDLGRSWLGFENAHVVDIDREAGTHEISYASGSDLVEAGTVSDLEQTFCRETVTTDDILVVSDTSEIRWATDPAADWGIGCYLGRKINVQNELYGTLCFVSEESSQLSISDEQRMLIDIMARWLGQVFERDAYERRILAHRDDFQLLADTIDNHAIFTLNSEGEVASWSEGAKRVKGYEEQEILGEPYATFFPEADREQGRPAELLAEAEREGIVEDEGWRVRKDGSKFWNLATLIALETADESSRGFLKITRDLTERREAQQALETERAFSNQALDALDDIFYILNPDGEIERINERVVDVTGYSREEIRSMDTIEFFVEKDRKAVMESIAETIETGYSKVEATVVSKDGDRSLYELRARRITDDDGTLLGVAGVGRDITEERHRKQRMDVANRVLRHNLRNDLNVIQGYADILEDESDFPSEARKISQTVDHLLDMAEKSRAMIEFAPTDAGAKELQVDERIGEIVSEFREGYPGVDIEYDASDDIGPVEIEGEYFVTAIRNIIENAIEHNDSSEPWVRVRLEKTPLGGRVSVHDNGPGIPDSERQVILQGTESSLSHGSGLGLWLIQWCAETMGGSLTLDERDPRGTVVSLEFPTGEAKPTANSE